MSVEVDGRLADGRVLRAGGPAGKGGAGGAEAGGHGALGARDRNESAEDGIHLHHPKIVNSGTSL